MQERLLEMRNGVSFLACLEASLHSGLVKEWERLSGNRLIATGINQVIDEATGYDLALMGEFADFVYTHVFCTWPE